jgi:hypothetical protein
VVKERLRTLDARHVAVAELEGRISTTADEVMACVAKRMGVTTLWAGA